MQVQWFGGPKDGEWFDIPEGMNTVVCQELLRDEVHTYKVPMREGRAHWGKRKLHAVEPLQD